MNAPVSTGLSEAARLSMQSNASVEKVALALQFAGVKGGVPNHNFTPKAANVLEKGGQFDFSALSLGKHFTLNTSILGFKGSPVKLDPAPVQPNQLFNLQSGQGPGSGMNV